MDVLERGSGEFFATHDPEEARQFFLQKDKSLVAKVMTVKEAVERFVQDSDYIAIGGFGANRVPVAICHEILRQGRKNLGFLGHTSTHDFQILCAGEAIDRCDIAYIIGLEARGLSPNARRYMESGRVRVTENSNYTLSMRIKAAAMGVPFLVSRNLMGSDTFAKSASAVVTCPFTGHRVVLHPAIYPDVAAIHVHEADVYGNCRLRGITVSDLDLARAAKRLIITAERLLPAEEIRRDPSLTAIPYYLVDAVCEVPYGSYPGCMPYEYFSDEPHLREWLEAEEDPERLRAFLERTIYSVSDFSEYIERQGGIARMMELRRMELLIGQEGCQDG
ncbi:MAG: CoA transferase subunit A [Bradymonadales bacterium]|nr:CoA transferase subunit A [Bradymonadales bacterium]